MTDFAHTPYDGSARPFAIGLAPLDPARWIEPDERLVADLAEKERLIAAGRDGVFRARPDTLESQAEIFAALAAFLPAARPDLYAAADRALRVRPADRVVACDPAAPLLSAARLVQDDLVLMRKTGDGWRLVAAALCFPSSWSLAEKFDRPMATIHADVPGFAGPMADRVARIFDHLRPGAPVWRLNWSIYDDDVLAHPAPKAGTRRWASGPLIVRVERQSLARMPASGDILFTIRIHLDDAEALARRPDGARLAAGLRDQLAALDPAQLAYKGLSRDRGTLLSRLDTLIERLAPGLASPISRE